VATAKKPRPRRHRNALEWTGVPWPARTGVGAAVAAGRRRLAWSVRRREHPARELGAGNDQADPPQAALRDRHAHVLRAPALRPRLAEALDVAGLDGDIDDRGGLEVAARGLILAHLPAGEHPFAALQDRRHVVMT